MAIRPYTVKTHDGKTVTFEAPEDAPREQLTTLAARALKAKFPDAAYQRPILDTDLLKRQQGPDLSPEAQGSISTYNPTLTDKIGDKISSALEAFGVGDRYARHVGERATSALADLTPVGAATEADAAKRAFGEGRYLAAAGHGALSALSAVPEGGTAKAMFLGVMAKNADRAALVRAKGLLKSGADRKQIWNETGWFQGADDKWRFEVPDNEMTFTPPSAWDEALPKANQYAQKRFGKDMFELPIGSPERQEANSFYAGLERGIYQKPRPIREVVDHPAVLDAYPASDAITYRATEEGWNARNSLRGSWEDADKSLRVNRNLPLEERRSTAAHELQHFVQGQEGFAGGGMVGTIPAHSVSPEYAKLQQELADALEEKALRADVRDPVTNRIQDEPAWHAVARRVDDLQRRIDAMKAPAEYEGYRRLAGEVEARNVQTRLDMTPGQRKEYAPWETEDVPREDQFVIWFDK